MTNFNTCRFCNNWKDQNMVKYGTRHYAHFKCYLEAGKPLHAIPAWQVSQFPYRLLKARGLLEEAQRLTEGEETIRFRARADDLDATLARVDAALNEEDEQ